MESQLNAGSKIFHEGKDKLAKDIGGIVNEATDLVKDIAGQKLESAKATIARAQSTVTDGARRYASSTDDYVHANPWKVLGAAAAAGVLIGILLGRR